ncbi:MAG: DegT/DnrJ/EryC1/StrS family aminotransferase, partial [Candidatus Omnitrophica bacterium]|nr:DegT/DnrJ/EryC1/StrS family aminotransferase [Candidatus Omnitrophota bacterium]
ILAAFGLAQMERLPGMLESLRRNRSRIKDGLKLPAGFTFRRFNDPGDAATFLVILAPNQGQADKAKEGLSKSGITPATLNYWHYEVNQELVGGSYPETEDYLGRAIVLEIKVKMEDGQLEQISLALSESLTAAA